MAEIPEPLQNPTNGAQNPVSVSWRIQYSRFFTFPRLSPTSPSLRPLTSRCLKNCSASGTWLSASSMAALHLSIDHKAAGVVLTVSLQGKVYEEHYISKLIFSWPQVSCLENCAVRGSRVVFASYRDSFCQVQKFAVRFSSTSEAQSFIHLLKEYLKGVIDVRNTDSKFGPKIASATDRVFTHSAYFRPAEELSNANPTGNDNPSMPSSFPDLFVDTYSKVKGPKEAEAFYLYNQAKAMGSWPESSFNAMLMTLETVISELGGDLAL